MTTSTPSIFSFQTNAELVRNKKPKNIERKKGRVHEDRAIESSDVVLDQDNLFDLYGVYL